MRFLFLAFLTFFCFACTERKTPADIAVNEKILLMGNAADPASLDPSLAIGLAEYKILCALFEGLVTADTKTLEVLPAAAQSWTLNGNVYEFKIRKDAKWSDGEDLKASDFVFAFKRILNPKLGAEYSNFLYPIKNAQKIHKGILPPENLGALALDEKTLRIELEYPCPHFLSMLYHSSYFPLPEHLLKKMDATQKRDGLWMRPQYSVSNGPFTIKKWRVNDKVSVRKNQNYHGAKNVKLEGIDFIPISNINTEERAFRAGQLHITEAIAPSRLDVIKKNMPQNLCTEDFLGIYYYLFNTSKAPLNDIRVRQALSIAIDRKLIIENFLKAGQKEAFTFVPENIIKNYKVESPLPKDIESAKKLLAQAGFADGKNFPKITLTYNSSEQHRPIAEAIQASWKKHLKIEVELYNLSWPAYLAARREGDFYITRSSWVADYASPESFLSLFVSDGSLNHSKWKSEKFDKLLEDAKTSDEILAKKSFGEAEKILLKEAPIMPIYFYKRVYLKDSRVKNWHTNLLDYHNYLDVDLESAGAK